MVRILFAVDRQLTNKVSAVCVCEVATVIFNKFNLTFTVYTVFDQTMF